MNKPEKKAKCVNKIHFNFLSITRPTTGVKPRAIWLASLMWCNLFLLREDLMSISAPPYVLRRSYISSVQDDTMSLSERQLAQDAHFAPYKELASLFNAQARGLSQSSSVSRCYKNAIPEISCWQNRSRDPRTMWGASWENLSHSYSA